MKTKLQSALKDAMRARNQTALNTIRAVLSALDYEEDQKGAPPDEALTVEIVKREVKRRHEEMDFATKGGRDDAIATLKEEISVLEQFLPQQLDAATIEKIIRDLKAADASLNMGGVMKVLKEKYNGQYDAKVASQLAKQIAG